MLKCGGLRQDESTARGGVGCAGQPGGITNCLRTWALPNSDRDRTTPQLIG